MALSDTQVRQLRAKLEAKHVKTRKANGADLHYVEGGTSSPKPTASSAMTPGIGGRLQAAACGAEPPAPITAQPTPPRCALASEPEISRLCGRDQGQGKARPLPRGKLTSLRSKVPRPMQPSGRSPPLATPLVLRFMTASSLACAKREVRRLRRRSAHGSSARHLVPKKQASTSQANSPAPYARR